MQPAKFEVGEACWLVSTSFPELNWTRVIVLHRMYLDHTIISKAGQVITPQWVYQIDLVAPSGSDMCGETALRKIDPDIHKPADESFNWRDLTNKQREAS